MGKIHWYKRDPDAALTGMMGLTLEERGAYNTILDLIYSQAGALPDDSRFISGWLRVDVRVWKRLRQRLIDLGKLYILEGTIRNSRADREVDDALSRVTSARYAGRASALSKGNKLRTKSNEANDLELTPVATAVQRPLQPTTTTTTVIKREDKSSPKKSPLDVLSPLLGKGLANDVIEHRQRLRKPMTTKAAELLAGQLKKCRDPKAGAEMMIERGWQSFKADWMPDEASASDGALDNQGIRKVENGMGDSERSGDRGEASPRDAADDLPGMFGASEEENRPVPIGDVQAGRDSVEMLALPDGGGGVL